MLGASCVAAGVAFAVIGEYTGSRLEQPRVRAARETLWMGGTAAFLAYLVRWGLRAGFGTG